MLAPRHPERFDQVEDLLVACGARFVRRSQPEVGDARAEVVLLDTLGELAGAYAAATVAFVGGSLLPVGGHNPIEPALWGKPIVFGPSMENFRESARALLDAKAAFQVNSSEGLGILLASCWVTRLRAGVPGRRRAPWWSGSAGLPPVARPALQPWWPSVREQPREVARLGTVAALAAGNLLSRFCARARRGLSARLAPVAPVAC